MLQTALAVNMAVPFVRESRAMVGSVVAAGALLAALGGCGGDATSKGTSSPAEVAGGAPAPFKTTEQEWLARVGSGSAQMARVCGRGARDRVAQTLCRTAPPPITSLEELYSALSLGPGRRRVAVTTHSLGLSARAVSGANPRVLVLADNSAPGGLTYESTVAVAFSRGEQLVELVALDPGTYEYNFYLVSFTQDCSQSRCTPEQLITSDVEKAWTGWTLYSDVELADTPLDCLSCHQPFGEGSHKLLQMRQTFDPWMHWSDFRSLDEAGCPMPPPAGQAPKVVATSEGLDVLVALEGARGSYAGVPLTELQASPSGDVLSDFLSDADGLITAAPIAPYPYAQFSLKTRETLCELFYTGKSPSWEEDRRASQVRGMPFPYFQPDVLDSSARAELLAGRDKFLRERRELEPLEVLSSLLAAEVAPAAGFVPRESDTASEILQGLCSRCHAASTKPDLGRSRFIYDAATISPATFQSVRQRVSLPPNAPRAMPPRNAGYLPPWAIERLLSHLAERCSTPGACQ